MEKEKITKKDLDEAIRHATGDIKTARDSIILAKVAFENLSNELEKTLQVEEFLSLLNSTNSVLFLIENLLKILSSYKRRIKNENDKV